MRARRGVVVLFAAVVLFLPAVAPPQARAAFPGANGPIAFERGGQIWLMQPDGSAQAAVPGATGYTPALSPDGTRVAYGSDGGALIVSDVTGSAAQQLWAGVWVWDPAWSPDGTRVVFSGCFDYGCGGNILVIANADGTGVSLLLEADTYGAAWSPDGAKIAYSAGNDIYLINPDGSGSVSILSGVPFGMRLTWSPDGSRIAYASTNGGEIWVMNADGSNAHYLAPGTDPSWSPDGAKMAYTCGSQICAMNADGTGPVQLTTEGTNRRPSWAPGGVRYDFTGFFAPVDNGVLNVAKAGSAIPVKFSLGGDQGLDIFAAGYPKAVRISCDTGESADAVEEYVVASTSGLKYDAASGRYQYNWKTTKGVTGCFQLRLGLTDGSVHTADFRLK